MDTKYFEVKTDTQSVTTDNVALEIQIVHPTKKTIGCALKTFPDYLFYWQHPSYQSTQQRRRQQERNVTR